MISHTILRNGLQIYEKYLLCTNLKGIIVKKPYPASIPCANIPAQFAISE